MHSEIPRPHAEQRTIFSSPEAHSPQTNNAGRASRFVSEVSTPFFPPQTKAGRTSRFVSRVSKAGLASRFVSGVSVRFSSPLMLYYTRCDLVYKFKKCVHPQRRPAILGEQKNSLKFLPFLVQLITSLFFTRDSYFLSFLLWKKCSVRRSAFPLYFFSQANHPVCQAEAESGWQ